MQLEIKLVSDSADHATSWETPVWATFLKRLNRQSNRERVSSLSWNRMIPIRAS